MEIALDTPFRLPRPSGAATMRPVSTNELTDAELILRAQKQWDSLVAAYENEGQP